MRVVLDACVLYPTVMREILLGVAATGAFTPLWSERILEEWARAVAAKLPDQEGVARAEIALLKMRWPDAVVSSDPQLEDRLHLPDINDRHVLASAIAGRADALVTQNLSDFPTRVLATHNVLRRDPDGFLLGIWQDDPKGVTAVCGAVQSKAAEISGVPQPLRPLLKKARLPRLAKALENQG